MTAAIHRRSGKTRRAPLIVDTLIATYGGGVVELDWSTPFELLVATILSAQSTDRKVNELTPGLFARYPDPAAYVAADEAELQEEIRATGFFRQKTKALKAMSAALLERHGGEVPLRMADLVQLPGVARKTANVVLSAAAPTSTARTPTRASRSTRTSPGSPAGSGSPRTPTPRRSSATSCACCPASSGRARACA